MQWFKTNPERQILLVLGICLVIAGAIGAVYLNFLQPHYGVLFSGLRDADAATIVAELDKQKASYQLKDGGSTIMVPADQVAKTRLGLMSTTIPLKGTVGFELFNKSDMGLTEFAQQINYQRALQGELARTIMAMDGVDEARVHLALPEHAIFRDEAKQPKASVTVLTRPGKSLSPGTIHGIQRLVAAAVPDLDIANVVVLDGHGAVVSEATPFAASGFPAAPAPASTGEVVSRARPAPAAARPVAPAPVRKSSALADLRSWIIGTLLLALVGAIAALVWRPSSGRRLTSRQRAEYAERLKAALEGRGADGTA